MYSEEIIDFFKRHNLYDEEMFKYLDSHTDMIDYYNNPEARVCIGAGHHTENGRVVRLRICIPYPVDYKTTLICIHEIVHGIIEYKHLNKKPIEEIRKEALPFVYEKLYLDEINNEDMNKFEDYLNDFNVDKNNPYSFALYARDCLVENYNKDFKKMDKLSKKLVKKYNKTIKN